MDAESAARLFHKRTGVNPQTDSVVKEAAARGAVAELLAAGHERVAVLLDAPTIFTMSERRAGALDAFAALGRAADPRRDGGSRGARPGGGPRVTFST